MSQEATDPWSCRLRDFFFPPQIELPPEVREELINLYPMVDWDLVSFRRGWPHLTNVVSFRAITLPSPHSTSRINIYVHPAAWNPHSVQGRDLIIHEGFHAHQLAHLCGGYGIGLIRAFTVAYLSSWAGCGFRYRQHPMELEARDFTRYTHENASPEPADLQWFPEPSTGNISDARQDHDRQRKRSSCRLFISRLATAAPGLKTLCRYMRECLAEAKKTPHVETETTEPPVHPFRMLTNALSGTIRSVSYSATGRVIAAFAGIYLTLWTAMWTVPVLIAQVLFVCADAVGLGAILLARALDRIR